MCNEKKTGSHSPGELGFLFEKWKHHDSLIYSRLSGLLTTQSFFIAAAGIILSQEYEKAGLVIHIVFDLAFLSVAAWYSMAKADRRCRNTFNDRLVITLINAGLLADDEKFWNLATWNPDLAEHAVNKWQGYISSGGRKNILATKLADIIYFAAFTVDAAAAVLALVLI